MLPQSVAEPWGLPEISITVTEMPISTLLSTIAYEAQVSVSIPPALTPSDVMSADYRQQPAQRIIEDIANRIDHVAEYDDGLVKLVPRQKALRDFLFIRSGHVDPIVAQRTLQAMLGAETTVEVVDDRILVSGEPRSLELASEYAKHLERGPDAWLLDIQVIRLSDSFRTELGIDWNLRGELVLNTAQPGNAIRADALVSLIAQAVETGTHATLEQTASLYCLEGKEATIEQGQRVPIPRFSTSPEGTTTTTGFDYITAGFTLTATARRVPGGAALELEPTISSVAGFVQQAPITNESTVRVNTIVQDGQWIAITGLRQQASGKDTKNLPSLTPPIFGSRTTNRETSILLVLVQANRIYSTNSPTIATEKSTR